MSWNREPTHLHRWAVLARVLTAALAASSMCSSAWAANMVLGSVSAGALVDGADPIIGISDIGRLLIDGGSIVLSDDAIVGDLVNGIGLVSVSGFATGNPSEWETSSLIVGDAGTATVEIFAGGIVSVDFFESPGNEDLIIGNAVNSVGTVIVNGLGSMLQMGNDSVIGLNGTGILRIENDGYVVATNDAATEQDILTVGVRGRVELDNGRLRTEPLNNNGVIIGHGRLDSDLITNFPAGHIEAGAGDRLVVNSLVTNQGEIAVVGGEIEFFKPVTSSGAGAELTLRGGGAVTFLETGFGYDSASGTLASIEGVNDIYGTVRLQGVNSRITVGGESTAVFHDLVTNAGGTITVFPGSSAVYLGGLTTSGSGSVLAVHLTDPQDEELMLGKVEVNGDAQLAGSLAINLNPGFVPAAGDTFEIVSAAGSVTGSLALAGAPPLPGGMIWELDINAMNVLLSVVATGDFNANGVVDAADYVVWRNTQGQTGDGLAADASGNGVVDDADYNFWRARFGNVVGAGSSAVVAAVPEPGAAMLIIAGAIFALSRKRRLADGDATIVE